MTYFPFPFGFNIIRFTYLFIFLFIFIQFRILWFDFVDPLHFYLVTHENQIIFMLSLILVEANQMIGTLNMKAQTQVFYIHITNHFIFLSFFRFFFCILLSGTIECIFREKEITRKVCPQSDYIISIWNCQFNELNFLTPVDITHNIQYICILLF